ncbi:AraC family transcriptional regulator [Burkholderia multivorans]
MRDTLLDPYEDIPRDVVVTSNNYPAGLTFPMHGHRRGQFAFASCGAISVATPKGHWIVPPKRAFWIPAGAMHEMTMNGPVTMLNAFVSDEAVRKAKIPAHCCVYGVSSLLERLLDEAIDLPALYDIDGRDGKLMGLLVAEIAGMRQLSLNAPLPADPRLVRMCRRLFQAPSITCDLDTIAAETGMSRRTLTRLFRAQTGVSFGEWRQQVCLLVAIERLSLGQPVTRVALDLGYASPNAFSAAFRRVLGKAPSQYMNVVR